MTEKPEKIEQLRAYASIFSKPRRTISGGLLHEPNEFDHAAAEALNFQADFLEAKWQNGYI